MGKFRFFSDECRAGTWYRRYITDYVGLASSHNIPILKIDDYIDIVGMPKLFAEMNLANFCHPAYKMKFPFFVLLSYAFLFFLYKP